MRNVLFTVAVAASLTTFAMGNIQNPQAAPQGETLNISMMQNCPMKVPGAELVVANVDNGITLMITTKSGDVADLRRRVEGMAKMHSAPANANTHGGMMAFSANFEEVPNGARITLTLKDPAQLEEFRAKVRQHAEQMKKGECSMMQGMMQGMVGGMKNSEPTPKPEPKAKPDEADHSAHHPPGEKK